MNASPNKNLVGYSYFEQMKDILPSFLMSISMGAIVSFIVLLKIHPIGIIAIQMILGAFIYIALSALFKYKPFFIVLNMLVNIKSKGRKA